MGVDTQHPQYERSIFNWIQVRDSIEGEAAIKSKNELYLPMPTGMTLMNSVPVSTSRGYYNQQMGDASYLPYQFSPNYHPNAAYSAYLQRAQFPEITAFILRGLLGLAMTDEPTVKLPSAMEYLTKEATPTGMTLSELYYHVLTEVLSVGRCPVLLNVMQNGEIGFVPYNAMNFINWKVARGDNANSRDATLVVFEEDDKSKLVDEYSHECNRRWVVGKLVGNQYVVEIHESAGDQSQVAAPSYKGKTLDYIPITCYGTLSNSLKVDPIPLFSVASCANHIYMKGADLSQAEFMSCNPTLIFSGVDSSETPKALGSTVSLCLTSEDAKAYYTTTDTSALNHVMGHITDLYEQAIYYGAQLLDSSKKASESAETVRLKQASSGATLVSIVKMVGKGMENQLKQIAEWKGLNPDEVMFNPITEFLSPALTAQEQTALVSSWTAGAISHNTLLDNFRRAGVLPEGQTIEEEMEFIKTEPPKRESNPGMSSDSSTNDEEDNDNAAT